MKHKTFLMNRKTFTKEKVLSFINTYLSALKKFIDTFKKKTL